MRRRVSPSTFAQLALAALVANTGIVLSGAAVRLTKSGLGCPTWPTCEDGRLLGEWRYHAAIEFGNRVFSLVVVFAAVACFLGALARRPRRRDLTLLSFGLVAGVLTQVVLGGITVLLHLTPVAVMTHFMVSMLILLDASVLWHRARVPPRPPVSVDSRSSLLARATLVAAAVVLVLGTATTAAGPHSGGEEVRRLGNLELAVKVHGSAVFVLLALALATRLSLQRRGAPGPVRAVSSLQLWSLLGQGVLGWVQYHLQLPVALVELHVAGALGVWISSVWLVLRTPALPPAVDEPEPAPERVVQLS